MAESKNNVITHGLSGKLGDLIVFRNRNGKTIVANKPRARTGNMSEAQKEHVNQFQEAVLYGKSVMVDPAMKAVYEPTVDEGLTVYNVAIADFFHAPEIKKIDVSRYTGKTGSIIKVEATDDFKVKEVSVGIFNADGSEVEHGSALLSANGIDWIYTVTTENTSLAGDKIVVQASDLPGHTTLGEKVL